MRSKGFGVTHLSANEVKLARVIIQRRSRVKAEEAWRVAMDERLAFWKLPLGMYTMRLKSFRTLLMRWSRAGK